MIDNFTLLLVPSFILLLTSQIHAQQHERTFFDSTSKVEHWLKHNKVPALAIGIIENGELKETRVYGELENGRRAPQNAIFNVASLTKPVVAILTSTKTLKFRHLESL